VSDDQKTDRPLLGVCVMVTRPVVEEAGGQGAGQLLAPAGDDPLAEQLRELGAEVVVQPAIRISPRPTGGPSMRRWLACRGTIGWSSPAPTACDICWSDAAKRGQNYF